MLNDKQIKIAEKLVEKPLMGKNKLAEEIGVNNRQLEYNLEKLNDYLISYHKKRIIYDGAFVSVPSDSYDFLILMSRTDFLSPESYVFNNVEREDLLFLFLLSGGAITLESLVEVLGTSKSTLYQDLQKLKKRLSNFNVEVKYSKASGYRLVGVEHDICKYLSLMISDRLTNQNFKILNWYFSKIELIDIQEVIRKIDELCRDNQMKFVETRKLEFVYIFLSILPRFYEPFVFPLFENLKSNLVEKKFAKALLKSFHISDDNCVTYIYGLALCTTIGDFNRIDYNEDIWNANSKFVDEFIKVSGINFGDTLKIKQQIFTHFKSMYYRLMFSFPTTSPLTDQIRQNYRDVFNIVKKSTFILQKELGTIPDDEVAFLTIHLLSFIYTSNQSDDNKKTVGAIVCQNGVASSTFLYIQLTNLFPNIDFVPPLKYSEMRDKAATYDVIFTTFYSPDLYKSGTPCFVVDPILSKERSASLVQHVYRTLNHNPGGLSFDSVMQVIRDNVRDEDMVTSIRNDLIDKMIDSPKKLSQESTNEMLGLVDVVRRSFIELDLSARTPEQAIRMAAAPLVKAGSITQGYVDHIVDQGETKSFDNLVIAPQIALPHTAPKYGANEIALGIGRLNDQVHFSQKKGGNTRYIFVLSAVDNTSHLRVMSELMQLLEDSGFFEALDSKNVDDVMKYLDQFFD